MDHFLQMCRLIRAYAVPTWHKGSFVTSSANDFNTEFKEDSLDIVIVAPDKRGIHIIVFLFLHEIICCGYSLEAPH